MFVKRYCDIGLSDIQYAMFLNCLQWKYYKVWTRCNRCSTNERKQRVDKRPDKHWDATFQWHWWVSICYFPLFSSHYLWSISSQVFCFIMTCHWKTILCSSLDIFKKLKWKQFATKPVKKWMACIAWRLLP